jgi:hypothetical protein
VLVGLWSRGNRKCRYRTARERYPWWRSVVKRGMRWPGNGYVRGYSQRQTPNDWVYSIGRRMAGRCDLEEEVVESQNYQMGSLDFKYTPNCQTPDEIC